jgi:ANTAR domain
VYKQPLHDSTGFSISPGCDAEQEIVQLREEVAGLRRAMKTRPVIDMARGMVMALGGCSPQDAFSVLVDVSQHLNVKLHEVARHLVDTAGDGPTPPANVRAALRNALARSQQGQ